MNKSCANLCRSLLVVLVWAFSLTLLGVLLFRRYSVVPSFPYYYILLLNLKDAAYALWGYFDGVHYLRLATAGYADVGSQAFFPLYPLLIHLISQLFHATPYVSGIIVSLVSLTLAISVLWKLFPGSKLTRTLSLLLFPTSIFFAGVYTESLFLFLSLLFFLCLKRKRYFFAALVASLASATRLVGVFLSLSLLLEMLRSNLKHNTRYYLYSSALFLVSISGFLTYTIYLWSRFGDPLMFLHVQSMFGAERSSGKLILLPQVLYRYAKMILTVDIHSFTYQRIWFELGTFLLAIYLWFKNLRLTSRAASLYVGLSLILPTLTGTLSSFPRYVLVLLPFLFPLHLTQRVYGIIYSSLFLLLIYFFSYYCYGTFIS